MKKIVKGDIIYWASLKTLFERKTAVHAVYCVKPPSKAYSLALSAFLVADALWQFCLFKPVFRDAHNKIELCEVKQ